MTEPAGEPRPPWHRNPWVWGVIAGLIFVPAVRPLTRHVPDAPPVLAPLPDYVFETAAGALLGSGNLRGRVYVLVVASSSCTSTCSEVFARAERLADRFHTFDRDISVVGLDFGGGGRPRPGPGRAPGDRGAPLPVEQIRVGDDDSAEGPVAKRNPTDHPADRPLAELRPWNVLHGSRQAIVDLIDSGLRPIIEMPVGPAIEDFSHLGRVFLVDTEGALRGHFASDESGLDEVYHRAQHVLREYRRAHRWER